MLQLVDLMKVSLLLVLRIVLGIKDTERCMSKKGIEAPESFRKAWPRQKLRGWNAMNGRWIDTFVLTWVYDGGKNESVAFDEGPDLHNLV